MKIWWQEEADVWEGDRVGDRGRWIGRFSLREVKVYLAAQALAVDEDVEMDGAAVKLEEKSALQRKVEAMTFKKIAAWSRAAQKLRSSLSYSVDISPEEYELLRSATLLNRRMLDRSPEHEIFDRAFSTVMSKCFAQSKSAWRETGEAAFEASWCDKCDALKPCACDKEKT